MGTLQPPLRCPAAPAPRLESLEVVTARAVFKRVQRFGPYQWLHSRCAVRSSCVPSRASPVVRRNLISSTPDQLTTMRTRERAAVSPATKGRQSSGRYGAAMETASATMILDPSHLAGIVRLNASKRSCASRVTPLPRRASLSCSLPTAVASRVFNERISSACKTGTASEKEAPSALDGGRDRS